MLINLPAERAIIQNSALDRQKKLSVRNMVDWFSAEITSGSNIALPWANKYLRNKVKRNGREIWGYRFKDGDNVIL